MADWEYKLYCVVSREAVKAAGGNRGKMMSQSQHAALGAWWDSEKRFPDDAEAYKKLAGHPKITLVADEAILFQLFNTYKKICGVDLIKDAAHTVFTKETITCLGIGPLKTSLKGQDLNDLKVFI